MCVSSCLGVCVLMRRVVSSCMSMRGPPPGLQPLRCAAPRPRVPGAWDPPAPARPRFPGVARLRRQAASGQPLGSQRCSDDGLQTCGVFCVQRVSVFLAGGRRALMGAFMKLVPGLCRCLSVGPLPLPLHWLRPGSMSLQGTRAGLHVTGAPEQLPRIPLLASCRVFEARGVHAQSRFKSSRTEFVLARLCVSVPRSPLSDRSARSAGTNGWEKTTWKAFHGKAPLWRSKGCLRAKPRIFPCTQASHGLAAPHARQRGSCNNTRRIGRWP